MASAWRSALGVRARVGVSVAAERAVAEGLTVADGVCESVPVAVSVSEGVMEGVEVVVSEAVGEGEAVGVGTSDVIVTDKGRKGVGEGSAGSVAGATVGTAVTKPA